MGKVSSKDRLYESMRGDKAIEIKEILTSHTELINGYVNKLEDHTALCMAAYFGSLVSSEVLLELGSDVNKPEKREGSSPLIIAAKRNQKGLVKFLVEHGADVNHRNNSNLNALDFAVIHGNYEIADYMMNKFPDMQLKTLDEYLEKNNQMKVPCFNIPLFYLNLTDKVEPSKVPCFQLTNDEKRKFEGKIPDPDETWGHFFQRILRFEIYQPPLVEKSSVPEQKKYSLYVKMQTKLLEMEYQTEIPLENQNVQDMESGPRDFELVESSRNLHVPSQQNESAHDNKIEILDEVQCKDRRLSIKDDLTEEKL